MHGAAQLVGQGLFLDKAVFPRQPDGLVKAGVGLKIAAEYPQLSRLRAERNLFSQLAGFIFDQGLSLA